MTRSQETTQLVQVFLQEYIDEYRKSPTIREIATGGVLQFSHAATAGESQDIAAAIDNCGEAVIRGIIESASVDPILNGSSMVVGSTNITVYINMNYTLPTALSGAPSC